MYGGTNCALHRGSLAWTSFIRGRGTCVFVQRCCPLPKPPVGLCPPRGALFNNRSPQGEDFCSSRQATCSSYGPKVSGLRQLIMRAPGSGQLGSVGGSCSGSHTAATTGRVDLVSSPSFLVLGWHGGTCGGWAGISLCMQPLHGAFQRLAVSRWSDFLQITSSRLYSSSSYGAHPHSRRGVVGPTDFACLC